MTRLFTKAQFLLAGGIYLLSVQPSFAQTAGHAFSFRGFVLVMIAIGAAYWGLGHYFKNRRNGDSESGFRLPPAAWFLIAAVAGGIGNVLLMMFMLSISPSNDMFAGTVAIFYFLFGWVLPGTVVALVQMLQTPAPESLMESHNKVVIPTLGGYFLTMLWMNDIGRSLGLTG